MSGKIVDCFTFYNGLDVLEVRLNSLAPHVDSFVIVESPYDMVGKRKPLVFDEHKKERRFSKFNIIHLVVSDHLEHMSPKWEPYYYQIDYLMRGLHNVGEDDMVFLSDFDEIPDMSTYIGGEGIFHQRLYYYYFNVFTGEARWPGTTATLKRNIINLRSIRQHIKKVPVVGIGWHFSYISPVEDIIKKIEAFCHRELDTEEIKKMVAQRKSNLQDPFGRSEKRFVVEEPSGPEWLLNNYKEFGHLFYEETKR